MQSIRFYYINYRILDDLEHLILILNWEAKETSALNRRSFTINLYSCNSWHANKQKKKLTFFLFLKDRKHSVNKPLLSHCAMFWWSITNILTWTSSTLFSIYRYIVYEKAHLLHTNSHAKRNQNQSMVRVSVLCGESIDFAIRKRTHVPK